MEEVAKDEISFLDKFVITYFRKLPTEKCFQELTEDTKELLFQIFICTPTDVDHLALMKEEILKRSLLMDEKAKKAGKDLGIDLEAALETIKRTE